MWLLNIVLMSKMLQMLYYKLMRPEAQIKSYIEDALRSSVPKLTLDELFEKKDEIALEVQHQVAEEMTNIWLYHCRP